MTAVLLWLLATLDSAFIGYVTEKPEGAVRSSIRSVTTVAHLFAAHCLVNSLLRL